MFCTKVENEIKLILIIPTRVTHVLKEPIVSTYNGCEPTSSEILPYFLTKKPLWSSGSAHLSIQIKRRLDPPSRRLI